MCNRIPREMARTTALEAGLASAFAARDVPFLYRILRPPIRRVLERFFDLDIEGQEKLPSRGPFIVAANHHNYLDGIVLAVSVPQPLAFLVMPRVWRATPLHPLLHRHIGSIPLSLSRPDVDALRSALRVLRDGGVVAIFPEGPFSVHGRLEAGLPGVGLLALRSGVPVVPAGIRGTYGALVGRRAYVPRCHPLAVRFGSARRFAANGTVARVARTDATQQIMDDIAALLA
jgi:1-acyl-sn-glycerol-3-phosphate acyltransferase